MKLFGLYSLSDIPHLKENHRLFADFNRFDYFEISIRNSYEKWVWVYRLLESHPGETLAFIDAFSFFSSDTFPSDVNDPILIQDLNGKVMDNFFVVRSCIETQRVFHEILRTAQQHFCNGSFMFSIPMPNGIAKHYCHKTSNDLFFNVDLAFIHEGRFLATKEVPTGAFSVADQEHADVINTIKNILVVRYGGYGWDSQFWSVAEILCQRRRSIEGAAPASDVEVVNPGRDRAILTLSSTQPDMPLPEYAAVSERNFRRYAATHDVTLYLYKGIPEELSALHSTWTKPYLLLRHLPEHQYLSWVDGDILISNDYHLPEGEDVIVYNDPGAWFFNAGFMTFRNSRKSADFLQAVISRCEAIGDRSTLYVNGSDQSQFIEEFKAHFPDALPHSNLEGNTPPILSSSIPKDRGLWHFMGINPPSIRAIVMDWMDRQASDNI